MQLAGAPGRGGETHQEATGLDLHCIGGHRVLFEARLAFAGAAVEFPVVPGTDDVVPVEPAFAERPADVIAGVRDRPELPVLERHREVAVASLDMSQRYLRQFLGGTDVSPALFGHGLPPDYGTLIEARVPGGSGRGSTSTCPPLILTR